MPFHKTSTRKLRVVAQVAAAVVAACVFATAHAGDRPSYPGAGGNDASRTGAGGSSGTHTSGRETLTSPCVGVELPGDDFQSSQALCARPVAIAQGPLRGIEFASNGDLIAVTEPGTVLRYRDVNRDGRFEGASEVVTVGSTGGPDASCVSVDEASVAVSPVDRALYVSSGDPSVPNDRETTESGTIYRIDLARE